MFRSLLILVVCIIRFSHCFSDVGKWDLQLSGATCEFSLAKSLFKGTEVTVVLKCDVAEPTNITFSYQWMQSPCSFDYFHNFETRIVRCANLDKNYKIENSTFTTVKTVTCSDQMSEKFVGGPGGDVEVTKKQAAVGKQNKASPLFIVEHEGVYILRMAAQSNKEFKASLHIEMLSPYGYLSAAIWPLLVFFGVMCGVYTVLCATWLTVCALQWRDLLRIQYWIGGVALLGMIESATYYGVYSSVNSTGLFNAQAYLFAEWVSVAKRALARMLVIIVSLGFGIVKPRLGPALQRVVGTGALWGVLATIESWLRLYHKAGDTNKDLLLSEAPLSLLDSAICWWVFVSLAHTMRTLQLRRNTIKLSLYRHFTNTLIFAVISSVIFMLYSMKSYRMMNCISDWKEVWMDQGYWHILFASVLTVIMVLWRPTNNNQRYAFTPLLDNPEDDDEEEEQFVNDAYGVKMRGSSVSGVSGEGGGPEGGGEGGTSLDADLRWVEENIPASTLPLLDSDEEIINTKFEVSKMQ